MTLRDSEHSVELTQRDLAIATLLGRYIERREHHHPESADDLLADARLLGPGAADELATVITFYEAMRHADPTAA